MQAVVVTRFLRTLDLVLQRLHRGSTRYDEWLLGAAKLGAISGARAVPMSQRRGGGPEDPIGGDAVRTLNQFLHSAARES